MTMNRVGRRRFLAASAATALVSLGWTWLPDRDRYGRVVHLVGDSVMLGSALGLIAPNVPVTHPLYLLRSPEETLNLLLGANGVDARAVYAGYLLGLNPQAPGSSGMVSSPLTIRKALRDGEIRAGDVVVCEDAGNRGTDAWWYRQAWRELRAAIADRHSVTAVLCTTPDYPPAAAPATFDEPFPDSLETPNGIIRDVAREDRAYPGQTLLADVDRAMDWRRASVLASDGVDLMLADGVHPGVWGQLLLCGQILRASGLRSRVTSVAPVSELLTANLGSVASGMSASRANDLAAWLLLE